MFPTTTFTLPLCVYGLHEVYLCYCIMARKLLILYKVGMILSESHNLEVTYEHHHQDFLFLVLLIQNQRSCSLQVRKINPSPLPNLYANDCTLAAEDFSIIVDVCYFSNG
ncbi:hypothetical protein P8452_76675 [Trifolium repens]|nr:hypothetical protein P8452_76675 [Trifolium repens]